SLGDHVPVEPVIAKRRVRGSGGRDVAKRISTARGSVDPHLGLRFGPVHRRGGLAARRGERLGAVGRTFVRPALTVTLRTGHVAIPIKSRHRRMNVLELDPRNDESQATRIDPLLKQRRGGSLGLVASLGQKTLERPTANDRPQCRLSERTKRGIGIGYT